MAARLKRSKPLIGILAKAIKPLPERDNLLLLAARGEFEKLSQAYEARIRHAESERMKRVPALLEHYGIAGPITTDTLLQLVLCMGEELYPGLRVETPDRREGRKRVWDAAAQLELIEEVEQERKRHKRLTQLGACMNLTKSGRRYSKHGGESLLRIYRKARQTYPQWAAMLALPEWQGVRALITERKKLRP